MFSLPRILQPRPLRAFVHDVVRSNCLHSMTSLSPISYGGVNRRVSSTILNPLCSRCLSTTTDSNVSSDARTAKTAPVTTHFGYEDVLVTEKQNRVRQVFDSVADSYDVMNDFMSFGLHRYWKDYLANASRVESLARSILNKHNNNDSSVHTDHNGVDKSLRLLDVAGGTGDVAFRLLELSGCLEQQQATSCSSSRSFSVTVCDINHEMLRVGERRARHKYGNALLMNGTLSFVHGDAQDLKQQQLDGNGIHQPMHPDNFYDLYTIAFGLRNVTDVDAALAEAYRVLKPGGRYMCLEFSSHVPNDAFRALYDLYSFHVIPTMGQYIANDRPSYQYLVESIRKFSTPVELLDRMNNVGFINSKYTDLSGGIVALHEGWKPIM